MENEQKSALLNAGENAADTVSPQEREILRRLAARVAELARRECETVKRRRWTAHNDLAHLPPLVLCDPGNAWTEIIRPEELVCAGEFARAWENQLRKEIYWGEVLVDDHVIEPWFNLPYRYTIGDWKISEKEFNHDYAREPDSKWRYPVISVDREGTARRFELASGIFGDLLPARLRTAWFWSLGLSGELARLRGADRAIVEMLTRPAAVHALMSFLRDGTMALINTLEQGALLSLNNEGDSVGSGGLGWTRELPAAGGGGAVRTRDLWCLAEAQEPPGITPALFKEFIFPYQLSILERFGLVCYGCCEALEDRWSTVARIPNLRRVSVSPWADRAKMAERLGREYIYSLKPNPVLLAGATMNEEAIRADLKDALEKARGCNLEIIMKDTETLSHDPGRLSKWVQIAREKIEANC